MKGSKHNTPSQESSTAYTTGKSRRITNDRWESQLWQDKKFSLRDHLHYGHVDPESIPRKFILEHEKFLTQQFNSQPAKYIPPEGKPPKLDEFQSARSLGHFEVTILGLNHEIAIDVAFLPMYSPEDVQASQIDTFLTCMNFSCVYPPAAPLSGRLPDPKAVAGAGDIVAIMIGNLKGTKILQSIQRGIQVTMVIEVGKKHGPWVNHYSIFFVSVSFFIITAATVGYFIFYSARRLRNARAQSRKQRQLKADAKKAIGKLQLRTLKQGDKEIGPDGDSCAVCIELYKPNDLVRILTCNHIFHKTCVDPWLLEHRTCPMCKCDILKALGIEVDVEDGSVSLQVPVSNEASNTASPHEEDSRSETASSGYASVQGADEPPLEEHAQSANENLQLVNHEANSVAVDVVPHVDNPTFEEDETPDQEAAVREIKS